MNRSRIEWCDHTWNPVTGCRHDCKYCYARRMTTRFAGDVRLNKMARADYQLVDAADKSGPIYYLEKPMLNEAGNPIVYPFGFEPTYHRYRMNMLDKLKMGNNIFVGAMADIFGAWVPDEWIKDILDICMEHQIHNYLFLTKNPERYAQYGVPKGQENLWYGTTITCDNDAERITSLVMDAKVFVSIEPLRGRISRDNVASICRIADWIIIGAETGKNRNIVRPESDWIREIVAEADIAEKPVFMKDSLVPIMRTENIRKDFPEKLRKSEISPKMRKKLFATCSGCKAYMKKSEMIALLARSRRGEQPKQFGFMCRRCFGEFCKELEIDIPGLYEFTKEADTDG